MSENGHESETRDKCPICLTFEIADPSIPGGCGNNPGHKFCFTCLRRWYKNNPNCPLCGTSSTFIRHRLSQNSGDGIIEPLTELKKEFLKEKIKEESEKVPLDVEKQLLHKYYRYLNTRLNTNDLAMENERKKLRNVSRRDEKIFKEREKNRQRLVQAINMAKSLEEACVNGSITRLELNKNPYFRGMIYDHHLKREDLFENEQRRSFTPQMAREELAADPHRLRNWLRKEIPIFLNRPVDQIDNFEGKIEYILQATQQGYIHAPEFEKACRLTFRESREYLDTFCNEFFDFASSQYSMNTFLQNSRYRSRESSQDAARGQQEVIQIDDYVPIDNDVQIVDEGQPNRSTEYSNYLIRQQQHSFWAQRFQPGHTDSEEEEDADIYMFSECRILVPTPASTANTEGIRIQTHHSLLQLPAFDRFGILLNKPREAPRNLADVLQNMLADNSSMLPSTSRLTRPSPTTQRVELFSESGRAVPNEEIILSSDDEGQQRTNEILAQRGDSQMQGSSRSPHKNAPVTPTHQTRKRKSKRKSTGRKHSSIAEGENDDHMRLPAPDADTDIVRQSKERERKRRRNRNYSGSPSDERWPTQREGQIPVSEQVRQRANRSRSYLGSPSDDDTIDRIKRSRADFRTEDDTTERNTITENSNLLSTSGSSTLLDVDGPSKSSTQSLDALSAKVIESPQVEESLDALIGKVIATARGDFGRIREAIEQLNDQLPKTEKFALKKVSETVDASTSYEEKPQEPTVDNTVLNLTRNIEDARHPARQPIVYDLNDASNSQDRLYSDRSLRM
ncbi:unnamed protein product, partial [Mesorhabditis belari]|uniref:RING-type E3 ubiquitin transferase n=1 Tax=Mesorhabditis belari TaxID=2138241 RepID=A0AAF3FGF6_9BILA